MAPFRSIGTVLAGFSYHVPHNDHNNLHLIKSTKLQLSVSNNDHLFSNGRFPYLHKMQQRRQHPQQRHEYTQQHQSTSHTPSSITCLKLSPISTAAHTTIAPIKMLLSSTKGVVVGGGVLGGNTNVKALFYMALLALQFGLQPILTKMFTPQGINRSTVVLTQDVVKFVMAGAVLVLSGGWASAVTGWNVKTWLTVAGIPASLYCIQNLATLMAYQNLEPLTFNVLNQTKTLSAALCCYLVMGKVQSSVQMVALLLLFFSACLIEKIVPLKIKRNVTATPIQNDTSPKVECNASAVTPISVTSQKMMTKHARGVLAVLLASFISGLAGALTQNSLQSHVVGTIGLNSYFFTMELCVASTIVMLISMLKSEDGRRIRSDGFFEGWTPKTILPILTNAAGGIIVGLVTKHAGAVKKGFALIFGLLISGIVQACMKESGDVEMSSIGGRVSREQLVGGSLAALSLWMHSAYPA